MRLNTLKKRREFLDVARTNRRWSAQTLNLQVLPRPDVESGPRVGFTVSKKTSKKAVARNRIKRRLRAAAGEILPCEAEPQADYVLIGKPAALDAPYAEILRNLRWCLKRLDMWRPGDSPAPADDTGAPGAPAAPAKNSA